MSRVITNMVEFREDMGERWRYAYLQFQFAVPEENLDIISKYDDEGYCIFEHVAGSKYYEFTGTAK